jgi:hypothetical protein
MQKKVLFWTFRILVCLQFGDVYAMSMTNVIQQIGQHTNMLPRERGMTLPIVSVEDESIVILRLFYFTRAVPGQGTHITSPQYIATYDLTNDRFIGLKEFTTEVAGLQEPPWIHNRPAFDSPDEIIPEFNRIWALYDVLIPAFCNAASDTESVRRAAREYLYYFHRHAEKPLLPYYFYFGGAFLKWVQSVDE